jgi:hypothetical protein
VSRSAAVLNVPPAQAMKVGLGMEARVGSGFTDV